MRSNRPYVQIDPDVLEQARQIDLLSYLRAYEPSNLVKVKGTTNVYCTVEHDSLKISNSKWYWWSRGFGGYSALDYLMKVKEYGFVEAVETLMGQTMADWKPPPPAVKKDEPKVLFLPPKNKDCGRVTEYLFGRGIDYQIIQECIAEGIIFESADYHNAVFIGKYEIVIVDKETVENLIYIVRGQKVMLDVALAKIYGYSTKAFNQQVKNNIEKFEEDFMFLLTDKEVKELSRSKILTLNNESGRGHNIKYNPYAFTESGLYMLMTVLRGELATAQSKALICIFKGMKDYISENRALIGTDDIARLAIQTSENTAAIAKITDEMLRKLDLPKIFKNFASSDTGKEFLIMNGQLAEADAAYQGIYAKAKNSIFIIDDYIGIKSIMHLRNVNPGVMITVFSDNKQSHLRRADLNDFRNEFPGILIDFKKTNNTMHDRYIILDYGKRSEKIYHCGASSKDAGKKTMTIMEVQDRAVYKQLVDILIKNPALVLT